MKKIVIPVLSLLFIISLDSCKKDSDDQQQPEEEQGPRLLKITSTSDASSAADVSLIEYDESGRIIVIKDSLDPTSKTTISYVGDEAIVSNVDTYDNGTYESYVVRYKLNSNYQPVQRIVADSSNNMSHPAYPRFSVYRDTSRYEYDAAGLLVKVSGTGFDTSWSRNLSTISFSTERKVYTNNYTNSNGKLMSIKIDAVEKYNGSYDGNNTTSTTTHDDSYSFEYNNNYANKADVKNAWVLSEWELLYAIDYPLIKTYANIPDKVTRSIKRIYSNANPYTNTETFNLGLEYAPSGYVSSATYNYTQNWDKYVFTYDK